MSKQQDELREKIRDEFNRFSYSVLGDYDDMPRRVDAIEKIINSEVQAALDRVVQADYNHWSELKDYDSYGSAFELGGDKQRTKFIKLIEEVRKDYE